LLAWRRVAREIREGSLGEVADRGDVDAKVKDAEEAAKDEVWGGYRFVVVADSHEPDGIKAIDLGAGHASAAETLSGRVIAALKSQGLLSGSVGAGYIERNWPPAFQQLGAWPLASLRQSFLNGALTRLVDPDGVLKQRAVEFVGRGDFGLGSGARPDGTYTRLWCSEPVPPQEVTFEADVYLLTKTTAQALKAAPQPSLTKTQQITVSSETKQLETTTQEAAPPVRPKTPTATALRIAGRVPPEVWNRLGTRLIPKLRTGKDLTVQVMFDVAVDATHAASVQAELRQILEDLGLAGQVSVTEIRGADQ
jgi:hypothetical protein